MKIPKSAIEKYRIEGTVKPGLYDEGKQFKIIAWAGHKSHGDIPAVWVVAWKNDAIFFTKSYTGRNIKTAWETIHNTEKDIIINESIGTLEQLHFGKHRNLVIAKMKENKIKALTTNEFERVFEGVSMFGKCMLIAKWLVSTGLTIDEVNNFK